MGCQYDWVEIHISRQGGKLAFTPRKGFRLLDGLVEFETSV